MRLFKCALVVVGGLTLAACGDDLDPAWKIKTFRVFGVRVDNATRAMSPTPDARATEAAPGETVRLSLSYFDPSTTPRSVQAAWVFCAQTSRMGNTFGCDRASAVIAMGVEANITIPSIMYGVDPTGRARIQGIGVVCAGGTIGFDAATMQPECEGQGAEGVVMTRSILVRTLETAPINHNPEITEVVFYNGAVLANPVTVGTDGTVRVPRCTGDPCNDNLFEVRVSPTSREMYRTLDATGMPVTRPERLQFGYFTTGGEMDLSFTVDTAERPSGPVRNKWKAPRMPGPVDIVFTVQDQNGGFDFVRRRVVVE